MLLGLGIMCLLMTCGCSGGQELHEKFIVQGIAVDKIDDRYKLTAQAYDFQTPKDEKEPSLRVVEVGGATLLEALENIKKKTSLTPVYSQNMVILMGENVAEAGVNNFMDFFIRHCEARPKVKLCVCSGEASNFLKIKQEGDKVLKAQNIHDLIPDELNSDVMHFVGDICGKISDPYVAWLGLDEKKDPNGIAFKGVGIFDGDVLRDCIDNDEAYGFMIFKNIKNFSSCVVKNDYFGEVTCSVTSSKVDIVPEIEEGPYPVFRINMKVNMSAFAFDNDYQTGSTENDIKNLESDISKRLKEMCESVLKRVLSLGLDIFGFGKILRNKNPDYFKSIGEEWKNLINKCEYNIDQEVKVSITGKEPI